MFKTNYTILTGFDFPPALTSMAESSEHFYRIRKRDDNHFFKSQYKLKRTIFMFTDNQVFMIRGYKIVIFSQHIKYLQANECQVLM